MLFTSGTCAFAEIAQVGFLVHKHFADAGEFFAEFVGLCCFVVWFHLRVITIQGRIQNTRRADDAAAGAGLLVLVGHARPFNARSWVVVFSSVSVSHHPRRFPPL